MMSSKERPFLTGGLALCTLLLAAGCVHYRPKPISASKNADLLESRSLTNSELKAFLEDNLKKPIGQWPLPEWDLDALTWAAFYYHPSFEVARAQWGIARGGEVTAKQRPNPVITVSPSYNVTTPMASPWLTVATLDVPIETAGKRGHRRQHAAYLAEAARLNIAATAYTVRSQIRTALVDVVATQAGNRLIQQELGEQQELVRRMEQQVQAGAISSSEALPIRLAFERARLDAADSQRALSDARSRLAEAAGLPLAALDGIEFKFDLTLPAENPDELTKADVRRQALLTRSDILSALADYKASEAALQLEIAKQYPDVHLQPGYEFDQGDSKWGLGFSLELPILHHNQGPIAEALARREESAAKFNALQAKVLAEIDRAVAGFRTAQSNTALLRALNQTAQQRQQVAENQFKAGAIDQTEVLNARLEAAATRLIQLDGEVKLQHAIGGLEDAVQRPIEFPGAIFQGAQTDAGR